MGTANTKYDSNSLRLDDPDTALSPDRDRGKVRFYSKDNFGGNIYEIEKGNYTSNEFITRITPDNIFSITIPPQMYVKMYCGDVYDYGGKGFMHIENATDQVMHVPILPESISGQIRSVSIGLHDDTQVWAGSNNLNRYDTAFKTTVNASPVIDDQVTIYSAGNGGNNSNNGNNSNGIEHFYFANDKSCYSCQNLSRSNELINFILFLFLVVVILLWIKEFMCYK
jgi:hypothetical protein